MAYEKIQKKLSLDRKKRPITSNTDMYKEVKKILNKEMRRKDQKDCELIDECVETLLMLSGHDIDKLNERTNQTNGETLAEIHKKIKLERPQANTGHISSSKRRKVAFATAWMVIVLVVASTVAYAFGFEPLEYIKEILGVPVGESIMIDGITYVRHGEVITYDTIEELFNDQEISLIYPSYLPEGICITQIGVSSISYDDMEYIFEFSSNDLTYAAHTYQIYDIDVMEDQVTPYKTDNNIYHILEEKSRYTVYFEHDRIQYTLQYSNYEELIKMIENMKGYE